MSLFFSGFAATSGTDLDERNLLEGSMSSPSTIPDTDPEETSSSSTPESVKSDFSIPWHKFSRTVTKKCASPKCLTASETREVKRIVSDEMLGVGVTKRGSIRKAAKAICDRYPCSFEDRGIGGTKLGNGYQSLFSGIENRIYNETHKIRKRKAEVLQSKASDDSTKGTGDFDMYGCKQGMWLPHCQNEDEVNAQMEKKKQLQNLKELPDGDVEEVTKLMTDTYHLQRKDICSGMPIVELNKEWPFLLTCKCLVNHFHMLTEINLQSAMEVSLHARNKGCRIYEYVLSGPQKKKSGDLKQWIRIIKAEVEETKSTDPQCQGVSFLLLHYFEEEEDRLFRFYGVSSHLIGAIHLLCTHILPSFWTLPPSIVCISHIK